MTRRPDFTEYVPYFADYVVKADDDPDSQLTMQAGEIAEALGCRVIFHGSKYTARWLRRRLPKKLRPSCR